MWSPIVLMRRRTLARLLASRVNQDDVIRELTRTIADMKTRERLQALRDRQRGKHEAG